MYATWHKARPASWLSSGRLSNVQRRADTFACWPALFEMQILRLCPDICRVSAINARTRTRPFDDGYDAKIGRNQRVHAISWNINRWCFFLFFFFFFFFVADERNLACAAPETNINLLHYQFSPGHPLRLFGETAWFTVFSRSDSLNRRNRYYSVGFVADNPWAQPRLIERWLPPGNKDDWLMKLNVKKM